MVAASLTCAADSAVGAYTHTWIRCGLALPFPFTLAPNDAPELGVDVPPAPAPAPVPAPAAADCAMVVRAGRATAAEARRILRAAVLGARRDSSVVTASAVAPNTSADDDAIPEPGWLMAGARRRALQHTQVRGAKSELASPRTIYTRTLAAVDFLA